MNTKDRTTIARFISTVGDVLADMLINEKADINEIIEKYKDSDGTIQYFFKRIKESEEK